MLMAETMKKPILIPRDPDRQRKTERILEAIRAELVAKRGVLDGDSGIRQVTVSVKMIQGTDIPRAVIVNVETEKTLSKSDEG